MNLDVLRKPTAIAKIVEIILCFVSLGILRDHFIDGWTALTGLLGYKPGLDFIDRNYTYASVVDLTFLAIFTVSGQILITAPILIVSVWKEPPTKYLIIIYTLVLGVMSVVTGSLVISIFSRDKYSTFIREEKRNAYIAMGSITIINGIVYFIDTILTLREREDRVLK